MVTDLDVRRESVCYMPSPQQIADECRRIREGWSSIQKNSRRARQPVNDQQSDSSDGAGVPDESGGDDQ